MAITAMELFGRTLIALQPDLVLAGTPEAIEQALADGSVPVWAPTTMTAGRSDIPESWDVTSDSLAAWLADRLQAERLLLIKSASDPQGDPSITYLAENGMVDPAFPVFFSRYPVETIILGPGQFKHFDLAMIGKYVAGTLRLAMG